MTASDAERQQALTAALQAGVRHDRAGALLQAVDLAAVPRTETGQMDPDALAATMQTTASQFPELCREGAVPLLPGSPRRAPEVGHFGAPMGATRPQPVDRSAEILRHMYESVGITPPTPPTAA
jgi:hypothetical protein